MSQQALKYHVWVVSFIYFFQQFLITKPWRRLTFAPCIATIVRDQMWLVLRSTWGMLGPGERCRESLTSIWNGGLDGAPAASGVRVQQPAEANYNQNGAIHFERCAVAFSKAPGRGGHWGVAWTYAARNNSHCSEPGGVRRSSELGARSTELWLLVFFSLLCY